MREPNHETHHFVDDLPGRPDRGPVRPPLGRLGGRLPAAIEHHLPAANTATGRPTGAATSATGTTEPTAGGTATSPAATGPRSPRSDRGRSPGYRHPTGSADLRSGLPPGPYESIRPSPGAAKCPMAELAGAAVGHASGRLPAHLGGPVTRDGSE